MCCDSTLAVDYVHVLSASSDLMKFCLHEAFAEIFTKTFIENFMESLGKYDGVDKYGHTVNY